MDIESIRNYCLQKPMVEEACPFGPETLVFKIGGKMFALLSLDKATHINLKCDPERAIELRESYSGVTPGFHMNKKHWNTICFNEDLEEKLVLELIDHSYALVAKKAKLMR